MNNKSHFTCGEALIFVLKDAELALKGRKGVEIEIIKNRLKYVPSGIQLEFIQISIFAFLPVNLI